VFSSGVQRAKPHRHTDIKAAPLLNSGVQTGRPYYYLASVVYTRQGVVVTWRCNRDRRAASVPYTKQNFI